MVRKVLKNAILGLTLKNVRRVSIIARGKCFIYKHNLCSILKHIIDIKLFNVNERLKSIIDKPRRKSRIPKKANAKHKIFPSQVQITEYYNIIEKYLPSLED